MIFSHPQFNPVALQITDTFGIHWYGLMYLIGFLAFLALGKYQIKHKPWFNWTNSMLDDVLFYGALGVILGGRIGYVLFYQFGGFLQNPLDILKIWQGGMSFHGGLIGVMVAVAWWSRKNKLHVFDTIDFVAPIVPPGLALGRFGNFINGELWGKFTQADWAVIFPQSLSGAYANLTPLQLQALHASGELNQFARHPTQLYQMLLEGVLLFVFLFWFTRKPRARYAASGWFALLYGILRFLMEFLRIPDAQLGYYAGDWLTMGQILSVPLIVIGLVFLFMSRKSPVLQPMPMIGKDVEAKK